MKSLTSISITLLTLSSVSQAAIVNFLNLNTALTGNGLTAGVDGTPESATGVSVTGSLVGNNYEYDVTYSADINGDSVSDTLTFTVLIEGFSGGTNVSGGTSLGTPPGNTTNDASVTLGNTETLVTIDNSTWRVGNNRFSSGETLKFSVIEISSTIAETVAFTGFDQVFSNENASNSHQAIIGLGTGLLGQDFNNNLTLNYFPGANATAGNQNNPTRSIDGASPTEFYISAAQGTRVVGCSEH